LVTSGGNNTLVGYQAGDTLTTGTGNVVLGYDQDVPAAGTSNYLNLGGAILGETSTGNGQIAFRLTTTAGITASTMQTQGQGALTARVNQVSVVANLNDTVTLPTAVAGMEVIVMNHGVSTLQVFPASGDAIYPGAVDASTVQLTTVTNRYVAYDSTTWVKL
jgi:hypothetical protein